MLKKFHLAQIETKDHLLHQGIYFEPKKRGKCAILWIHGFMSAFYRNLQLWETLAQSSEKYGFGFAVFNNRGHDIVTGIKKINRRKKSGYSYTMQGASSEKFVDCVYDIEAGIKFLLAQKFTKIILVGHSTGANKVCYYSAHQPHSQVAGVVLAGPVSDRLTPPVNALKLKKTLHLMLRLIKQGKGDRLVTEPPFFPMTPKRFISLYQPRSPEDTFDYGDAKPLMKDYSKIKLPLLVIFGENDEFLDRPVQRVIAIFDAYARSSFYTSAIIPKATHGFNRSEQQLVKLLFAWYANDN